MNSSTRTQKETWSTLISWGRGREDEFKYENAEGNMVYFDFVGVLELACLGIECAPDEVWYDIQEMMLPMERRNEILTPESKLWAIALEKPIRADQEAAARDKRRKNHKKNGRLQRHSNHEHSRR